MTEQIILSGMVISSMPVGEYDKRLVLLTKERGKITAFCRGARRQTSMLLGATEPFVFGSFHLVEGRSAYTLVQAEITHYFMELREDFKAAYYGFYFLELAGYYARENMDGGMMLNLLVASMRAVCKKNIDLKLIRRIYELKIMTINGEYPQMFECMRCGRSEVLKGFSAEMSGVICEACMKSGVRALPLNPSTIYTMQYIISSEINRLYTFTVKENVLEELSRVMEAYMRRFIDKRFKSLDMLEFVADN